MMNSGKGRTLRKKTRPATKKERGEKSRLKKTGGGGGRRLSLKNVLSPTFKGVCPEPTIPDEKGDENGTRT